MGKTRGTLDLAPQCVEVSSHPMTPRLLRFVCASVLAHTHTHTYIVRVLLLRVQYVCSQNEDAVTEAVLRSPLGSRLIQSRSHVRKVILVSPTEDKRLVNFVLDGKKKRK